MLKHKVTVGSSPSGTFATRIPMAKIILAMSLLPVRKPAIKKVNPSTMAIVEITLMK
jgi:hypothetical protein